MERPTERDKWVLGVALFLFSGSLVCAYNSSNLTFSSHAFAAVTAYFVVRFAMKQNRNFGFLVLVALVVGYLLLLAANQQKSPSAKEACQEYERAYKEEPNLDPAANAVIEALNLSELDALLRELDALFANLEDNYPDYVQKASEGFRTEEYIAGLSPDSRQAVENFELKFVALHDGITNSCKLVMG